MKNEHSRTEPLARPESGVRIAPKLLERDLKLLVAIEKLHDDRARASAESRAKTGLLSSLSQELRRPLNAMLGFAQLLARDEREPLTGKQRERVERILRGGEHVLKLLDGAVELCQLDADPPAVHCEATRVSEVIADVTRSLATFAARRAIRLEVTPSADDLPTMWVDRARFTRVVAILGTNAIQYNRLGGTVTFAVDFDRPEYVRVTVQDTGVGIPAADRDGIFDLAPDGGMRAEGRGLGLVIAKRLASLMGGDLDFRTADCVGSWFWLDVPLITVEAPRANPF